MTQFLVHDVGLGWDSNSTTTTTGKGDVRDWMRVICPQVVDHFTKFPSFRQIPQYQAQYWIPIQSTAYAAQAVCTAQVVQHMAASIGGKVYLFAGSHLGALLHGQPLPWDDDSDMVMDYRYTDAFLKLCSSYNNKKTQQPLLTTPTRVELHCTQDVGSIKVWLQYEGMVKETGDHKEQWSTFLDLFLMKTTENGILQEVSPKGKARTMQFRMEDFYPTRPYYFGGILVEGPHPRIATNRYRLNNCILALYNHRREHNAKFSGSKCLDCQALYQLFPFANANVTQVNVAADGKNNQKNSKEQALFPAHAAFLDDNEQQQLPFVSLQDRETYSRLPSSEQGQALTDRIPNLNTVQVDNSISTASTATSYCSTRSVSRRTTTATSTTQSPRVQCRPRHTLVASRRLATKLRRRCDFPQ